MGYTPNQVTNTTSRPGEAQRLYPKPQRTPGGGRRAAATSRLLPFAPPAQYIQHEGRHKESPV
jgi:hypothetical protein